MLTILFWFSHIFTWQEVCGFKKYEGGVKEKLISFFKTYDFISVSLTKYFIVRMNANMIPPIPVLIVACSRANASLVFLPSLFIASSSHCSWDWKARKERDSRWFFFKHFWLKLNVSKHWKYNKDTYEKAVDEAGWGQGPGLYSPVGCLWETGVTSGGKFSEGRKI